MAARRGSQRTTSFVFFSIVIMGAVYFIINPPGQSMEFDRKLWLQPGSHHTRVKMSRYIMKHDLLKGKNLVQVRDMLGDGTLPKDPPLELHMTPDDTVITWPLGRDGSTDYFYAVFDSARVFRQAGNWKE